MRVLASSSCKIALCFRLRRVAGCHRIVRQGTRPFSTAPVSPHCSDETISIPVGNNGFLSLIVTRPLGQSPPQKRQSSQGANVILYLPPGPLFQDPGDRSTSGALVARLKHHQAQGNGSPNPTSPPPQHVLASLTSATVVTVNYRFGTMQSFADSSEAAKPQQKADNLQNSITNDQLIDKSNFYQYPTPVHDTLAGFDWIRNNLHPAQLGVFGAHVGGSLALMLALTEAQSVRAVTALEPVCDWPGLDEYCVSEDISETKPEPSTEESTGSDSSSTTRITKQKRPSKRKGFRGTVAPPDLVPLLNARKQFFTKPEKCFDAFASPILFLRSAGRDVPRAFPQYLTGPEYPVPTTKSAVKSTSAEHYSALDGSLWDRDAYPNVDIESEDSDIQETSNGPVIRRRKALSRWPPYGLDYGLSGSTWSGPSNGIGRLQMTLPWVRILLPDDSLSSLVSLHTSRRTKSKEIETETTILARQAEEMVSVMQRACFWGQEKGVGERRVTLSGVHISAADGTVELDELGKWLKDALDGLMEEQS